MALPQATMWGSGRAVSPQTTKRHGRDIWECLSCPDPVDPGCPLQHPGFGEYVPRLAKKKKKKSTKIKTA